MSRPFQGVVNIDVRDSVPDWSPYLQPVAPEGAPNVLDIVLDDTGFSAMEPWGGLIETPNINRLAANGLAYTNWHTTALCSPTRSSLLTGRNHTTNGMACIAEATTGFPNANGHIPFECATIAEVLSERGWNTYMLGKWHLCPADEMNMASTKRNWPVGRGFERYYGFLGGETNQWYPDLVYDNHPVEQPAMPEDGYHLTTDLTDKAVEFIKDAKMVVPDKPFFMYFCPGATQPPTTRPRSGSRGTGAASTWATSATASRCSAPAAARHLPRARRAVPAEPICRGDERRRQAVEPGGRGAALGLAVRGRAAAVLPDGRGVRRVPVPHRPRDRAPARLPGGVRRAGEHHRDAGLRQRGQRRGRSQRVGEREQVLQRHPRRNPGEPPVPGGAWLAGHLQPLPGGLGVGVRHAVQDVEALQLRGRRGRPAAHLLAEGDQGQGRAAPPVRPRHRPGADHLRLPRGGAAGGGQGVHPTPPGGSEHPLDLRERRRADTQGDRVLLHAGVAGDLAQGLEGGQCPPDDRRLGQLQPGPLGALPHRPGSDRDPRPGGRASGEAPGADQPLVPRGRPLPGPAAGGPHGGRGPGRPHPAAGRPAAGPVRLLPGRGRGAGDGGGEHPQPPGTNPFPFTGGTIARAIVDVSGDPFIDLEKEAIAMMARE